SGANKISLETLLAYDSNAKVYRAPAEGGVFYFLLSTTDGLNEEVLKDITVSSAGSVSAEVVAFDPTAMELPDGVVYGVQTPVPGLIAFDASVDTCTDPEKAFSTTYAQWTYEYAAALAKHLNDDVKKVGEYTPVACNEEGRPVYLYVLKVTVEPNYSAAYKEGSFKVTAVDSAKKTQVFSATVISDVVIFEYEQVKWAASEGETLVAYTDDGYSDYDVNGVYGGEVYDYTELRAWKEATVVSTTAFRMVREAVKGGVKVATGDMLVEIPEIASSQKGVNFAGYGVEIVDAFGRTATKGTAVAVVFGYYGDQVIASDFTITVDLGVSAYELRDYFGEKVEEEDIITYYVVKDGKVADSFTVDYMKDEVNEDLVLEIAGKAGSTLGEYEVVLEAPAAPEGEENPNTGAESVIGVVAAMAVVSVAAAAAVSLKK
ncbi:MAG: hypothetical protein ACI4QY_00015, partial [Oscillospiraceae bacterium]